MCNKEQHLWNLERSTPERVNNFLQRNKQIHFHLKVQHLAAIDLVEVPACLLMFSRRRSSDSSIGKQGYRTIAVNDDATNAAQHFLHNRVTTAKYTMWTFFPKFFREQFSKYANLFFLVISCIQVSLMNAKLRWMNNSLSPIYRPRIKELLLSH